MPYKNPNDKSAWYRRNRDRILTKVKVRAKTQHAKALVKVANRKPHIKAKIKAVQFWHHMKSVYGLSRAAFSVLLGQQMACCANPGCRIRLHPQVKGGCCVDHNHALKKGDAGFIRGLLCPQCNWGLGQFRDSPRLLRGAALYLEQHGSYDTPAPHEESRAETSDPASSG